MRLFIVMAWGADQSCGEYGCNPDDTWWRVVVARDSGEAFALLDESKPPEFLGVRCVPLDLPCKFRKPQVLHDYPYGPAFRGAA